jgi:hypothetical protein
MTLDEAIEKLQKIRQETGVGDILVYAEAGFDLVDFVLFADEAGAYVECIVKNHESNA